MKKIKFEPVFFESFGAKSSCTLVSTPDVNILIDPGIAGLQPSFPAPLAKKIYWSKLGKRKIKQASKKADIVIVSHYHYDHYLPKDLDIYKDKLLLVKNPNEYINDSQRKRAEAFFSNLCQHFGKVKVENLWEKREAKEYSNPLTDIPIAMGKNFGSYAKRREELLELGKKWFLSRVKNWNKNPFIPELKFKNLKVEFPEGKKYKFGMTKLKFTQPIFHGLEFSRVGWVFSTVIEYGKEKLIHSSDMDGPVIEDYAEWIIKENPDVLIMDGPATYMLGYMIIKTNLKRAIENMCRIVEEIDSELIIYDHHLLRDVNYKKRTKKVWEVAKKEKKKVITAAEYLGKIAIADKYKK